MIGEAAPANCLGDVGTRSCRASPRSPIAAQSPIITTATVFISALGLGCWQNSALPRIIDMWKLAATDRYIALIVMGAALLLVSFLYTRYREAILKLL
jgi:hypothetical protein